MKQRGAVTWRSITLGLFGTVIICALTPYNDYALNNTFLVGNNLPIGVMMLTFLFGIFINGPLSKWRPDLAFTSGEVAVAFSMTLVSCALPSSGLMRYFPAALVIPFQSAASDAQFRELMETMNFPRWLFPSFAGTTPQEWGNDPIVTGFAGRWTGEGAVPYAAWIVPAIAWGIFTFALYGAMICIVAIVRRQWFENERLPFPLAQIQLALVEQPQRGSWFNALMRNRSFWVSFGCIFALHVWNGMARYDPQHFPEIWVYYNFTNLFTEPPWSFLDSKMMDCAVFFTVVGVTYFLSSPVAFSLWFFYILRQLEQMWLGTYTGDPTIHGQNDQHFGGIIAFALTIFWVGRHHWKLVMAQAFRGPREGEPRGRYLPYPLAFWGLLGCTALMIGWLVAAGASLFGAIVMVMLLLLLFVIITRIIAETGLVHGQLQVPIYKPWTQLSLIAATTPSMAGLAKPVSMPTFYLGSILQAVHYDFREVVPVYASHGLKVCDQAIFENRSSTEDDARNRRVGRKIIGLFFLALFVGYIVSFASMLWTEYHFAWTKDVTARLPINDWGAKNNPEGTIVAATVQYERQNYRTVHSPPKHMAFGFIFTGLLGILRLRYPWWPLHPIGFLMIGTYPGAHLWLSICVGWLAKMLIVRFGGTSWYMRGKPFFLGLIVGESAAAGFWLLMGIIFSALGLPYRTVNIMPG